MGQANYKIQQSSQAKTQSALCGYQNIDARHFSPAEMA
jgi:hypothetical protein